MVVRVLRSLLLGASTLAWLGACGFDWDGYDPRLGAAPVQGGTSAGGAGNAGAGGSAGGTGGATSTGAGGTSTGTGGTSTGSGGGGSGGGVLPWTVVDTLTVPAVGTNVVSTFVLENGVAYRLRASGVCIPRDGFEGDAEWYDFSNPKTLDSSGTVDVGIGIDDPVVDVSKTPFWGPYDATHVYEVDFVGKGAPITAKFHDPDYDNGNAGELTVEVLALP